MRVELLYPAYSNQGGDNGNAMYLRACLPDAEFVETSSQDTPAFAHEDVDLILMGNMTERQQLRAISNLAPYAQRLGELADAGVPMLFSGNAAETLGTAIIDADGVEHPALGLFDFRTRQLMPKRFTCGFVGKFDPADGTDPTSIVGFKIQFTQIVGNNTSCAFARVERGWGLAEGSTYEGFRRGCLIATWVLGPVLTSNPDLADWLIRRACKEDKDAPSRLAYEDVIRAAYRQRLGEFRAIPSDQEVIF